MTRKQPSSPTTPRCSTSGLDPPSVTASELANRLVGTLHGDGDITVSGVATLEHAEAGDVSWVGSPEVLPRASASKAGVLVLPVGCCPEGKRTFITVDDPDLAVCDVLDLFAPPGETVPPGVHPTATVAGGAVVEGVSIGANVYVGADVVIGRGSRLFPGVHLGRSARLGDDCILFPNVVVRDHVTLGNRVVIHPNATIGADGYGYLFRDGRHRKIPQIGTVRIEDDVEIGAGTCIDRARSGATRIGRGSKIDNLVHIGHNASVGEHCLILAHCAIGGSTTIEHHVVLSGQVGVTDHVHIGAGVQVAGKSSVMSNIPDGKIVRGIPAHDQFRFLREQASLRRLPKLARNLRDLVNRIERLEERLDGRT